MRSLFCSELASSPLFKALLLFAGINYYLTNTLAVDPIAGSPFE